MATTVKELGDKLDEIYERVTLKLESNSKELSSRIESSSKELAEKLETSSKELTGKIDDTADDLAETKRELASVLATLGAAKWIGTVAVVITAFLGSAGIWKIVEDQRHLQETTAKNEKLAAANERLTKERAQLIKSDIIDRIERELTSSGSLDALKDRPGRWRDQLAKMSETLRANNDNLEEGEKTSYHLIVRALQHYHDEKYGQCQELLKLFHGEDEDHFGYLYLRGSCAARGNSADAEEWFKRATAYSSDRAQMVDLQRAYAALARWAISKNADDLRRGITIYDDMIRDYPRFFPAFINLAGAYSLAKEFMNATSTLRKLREFSTKENIVRYITKDMSEEKDFDNYVRMHLHLRSQPADSSWNTELTGALEKELDHKAQ